MSMDEFKEALGADEVIPVTGLSVYNLRQQLGRCEAKNAALQDALTEVVAALRRHTEHYECEDCWYSCPMAKGYCGESPKICYCGAEVAQQAIARAEQVLDG